MPPHAAPPATTVAKHTSLPREKRQLSVAEHVRTAPQQRASISPPIAREPTIPAPQPSPLVTQAAAQPASTQPAPVQSASNPVASGPSAPAANNAQFLEELRAIHAEIDARKRHMDSLTASLDSLKRVKPN
jgi:hypothetical protein